MLTFVPHLRDLDRREEPKYDSWLKELEDIDTQSGFKPMDREEKAILTVQTERAATLSLYLDTWLEELGIANLTKAALVAYMASQEPDDVTKPQKKTDDIQSSHETTADGRTRQSSRKAAALFAGAFKQAFENKDLPRASRIELRKILLLEESVDGSLAPKLVAKDADSGPEGDMDELTEAHLATYINLGCLICYSHSCDHGEYDNRNFKRAFSMGAVMPLGELLKQRRRKITLKSADAMVTSVPCHRTCHRSPTPVCEMLAAKPWLENEVVLLKSIFSVLGQSQLQHDPICFAADILDRDCSAVFRKFESLAVKVPSVMPLEPLQVRPLSWYCKRQKILRGEWQNHTITHEHQRREIVDPCSHEGVCTPQNCPCVKMGILCEKWCRCTAETCAYKFTGCGCHAPGATGKSCQAKGKGKPCLCVQLNRECDPALCQSCGVLERADPHSAESCILRETGCQNCELQRGSSKELLLGQSRLDGVGYGLFTAEDIAQDDFVIEYVGELITHDEGVRREARRSDVFDEESSISYIFTLLEHEGIWLDAAVYGNLSRYINHASGTDSNVTPRILYVNGEYRIKFTALQDIRAGEELFFDYGENFPNLTKKLLDTKMTEKPVSPRKPRRPPQSAAGKIVARKAPKPSQNKMERKKPSTERRRRR
ncbi:SET domain containing protein [Akanthomyces lecanii RCEF 1005]|uniref:SET domain containing protein n=1 Tax=Akanthomyces lecanii RCEF 1005 TaxID=1081108 RepID=A0A167XLV8_CORDF|nr:SET domain containing protein [Akanthomyces lecanii RCEF 1005]